MQGLTLRYAADEPPALKDVSFEVQAGSQVAIIGASGAGKSTLIGALLRFWDTERGEITLGGRDLRSLDAEAVRGQIGVVTQQTHLFNATVAENLLLARPGATQAQLEDAAAAAQIHDFIMTLPEGYATPIGEQGWQLSGGERQRLAIARAFLKDAPILLLDEPTANLDAATERALFQNLAPLMAGKTTLIITHRLERLASVDQILVLDGGRLVEQGSHAELLARAGLYRRLWRRQRELLEVETSLPANETLR